LSKIADVADGLSVEGGTIVYCGAALPQLAGRYPL